MLARTFRSRSVAALAICAMAGCAYTASPLSQESVAPYRVRSLTPMSQVIDAERIRRSGAITAWDAVRLLVPRHRLEATRGPSLRMLGAPGMGAPEASIRFIMDGHQIMELDALRAIPAREIIAIHILNASDAAMYFPASGGGGVIALQTRMSLRSR
jgi:TonB-dependent receptor-like protein